MDIIITIECLLALLVGFYLLSLAVACVCDLKRNALYAKMQAQVKHIEQVSPSMAVLHAKTYGVMENYRRRELEIERIRHFILENLLFLRKSTLKS